VIERDARDHRDLRHDYISRIEPSAHAHLHERDVTLFPGELEKRHRRHELEKTRMIVRVLARH
jgi:hypothetical protein